MIRTLLLIAALGALTSCAPHKIQYYQLTAVGVPAAPAPVGPALIVGRIGTAHALQDGRIRYREGPNEVGSYEYHRWTDPPGIMVQEALIHALRASGRYRSVQEPSSTTPEGDYAVRGKLLEFAEVDGPGIQTRVSLDLELREAGSGRLVWNQVLTHEEPVQAKKVSEVVQSLDRNLRTVLNEASSAISLYVEAHSKPSR